MVAPPRVIYNASHTFPHQNKGWNKGWKWRVTWNKLDNKGWKHLLPKSQMPHNNDCTESDGTKAVKEHKANTLTPNMQQHPW
jgi:hypothetical protein